MIHPDPIRPQAPLEASPAARPSILLVGNPALSLKNFEVAVAVLAVVRRELPIDVTWVAQRDPEPYVRLLPSSGLRIKLHISPPQASFQSLSSRPGLGFGALPLLMCLPLPRFPSPSLQEQLPELFRGHDCLLFTSVFEAWGMPVLEAMAAGTPVVSSRCIGVTAFAEEGGNCLMADPQVRWHGGAAWWLGA